jgi:dipeptidyl-peptidase-4
MVRMSLVAFGTILASAGCRATERLPDAPAGPAPRADCADPPIDDALLADHVATAGFTRGVPEPVAIGPDGTVVFRRTGPRDGVAALFELAPGRSAAQLAKPDQCVSMFRATDGVAVIDAADDASRILIRTGGAFCVVGQGRRAIDHTAFMPGVDGTEPCGPDLEQHLSPDGQRLAFRCSAGGIGTGPVDAPGSHTIAVRFPRPHEPEHSSYAVAEPAAQDFGRDRGYWWSPDGRWIVFQRTRPTAMSSGDAPNDASMAPGAQLPAVDLGIVSAAGGAPVWVRWDLARYPYLARVIWTGHAPLTLLVLSRDQTELAVLRADPATGATRVLLTEHDPAWVDVAPSRLTWLAEGSGFLWMSETDDGWTLWQHAR